MDRKEFLLKMGSAAMSFPVCLGMLSGCAEEPNVIAGPSNVDFTVDISTGPLSKNGGYIVQNGIIIARTMAGEFLALSAACTHEGTTVQYESSPNDFYCAAHGAVFASSGAVKSGPARRALTKYNTEVSSVTLRIYS